MSIFSRLKAGLSKTRDNIVNGIDSVFMTHDRIDDEFYEELEEILVMGDVGIHATEQILEKLKSDVKEHHIKEPIACKEFLINGIKEQMMVKREDYEFLSEPSVVMVIGVNGVGKTTTIGKLANIYRSKGKKVLIAAADTFRAAATEQLEEWAKRAGVDIIKAGEGADPSSVIYDATCAAKSRGVDVLLCDTAGRLHNKKNLMNELEKMNRIIDKNYPLVRRENLIVLDATTGQNALVQAKEFAQTAPLSGIVLTKMDGTAKGGIAIAIQSQLGIPVKFIGVGEGIEDLQEFDSDSFVNALFDINDNSENEETETC
ncbi:MAG: signal recognition particle-docking protein FtsY [Lachnospiraceae bacterium]|nr:signal recognition particle-docking protein FtsY [Candidatus Colinaster equi]